MEKPGVTANAPAEPTALPPYQSGFLARYSRSSKLKVAALCLAGGFAILYLAGHELTKIGIEDAKKEHHKAKIFSADKNKDKPEKLAEQAAAMPSSGGSDESLNRQDDRSIQLSPAPDPDLTESTAQGDLPRIGEDGRQPWQSYARPFNAADKRPRLAIVVGDLGLTRNVTDIAVSRLPPAVTLAFDVQGANVASWCGRARQEGHETLLSVPMEPFDYPRSDPGPHTLLTSLPNTANLEKLNWALRQASGYIGITTMTGSRFTTDSDKLRLVMQTLHQRGLMVLDAHTAPYGVVTEVARSEHVPVTVVTQRIDDDLSPEAIDTALKQLEQAARLNGKAVGVVSPLPVVLDHLQAWLKTLPAQGITLTPVSALAQ